MAHKDIKFDIGMARRFAKKPLVENPKDEGDRLTNKQIRIARRQVKAADKKAKHGTQSGPGKGQMGRTQKKKKTAK